MTGNGKLVVAAALAAAWSSVGAADAATDSPYGACAHITVNEPPARTCAAMRGAGLAWVRSGIDWRKIEKTPGVFDFSKYDRVVAECEAEGVQLLPVVFRPPAWAKRTWEHLRMGGVRAPVRGALWATPARHRNLE
ncbi:MAG: beta-galactosidase [Kiritimatiellae bacterium]|nr:beta-galactosidase [Kiritimatiellia bacterium]